MSDLRWGQFQYADGKKSLTNVLSGQTIRLQRKTWKVHVFVYSDGNVEVPVIVQQKVWGWHVDFDDIEGARENCGLWRRLAFFLPDSLAFWFRGGRTSFEPGPDLITLQGGWQNGTWNPSSLITCNAGGYPHDPQSPLNPPTPQKRRTLPSLDSQPTVWRFLDAESIVAETKLATMFGDRIAVLDHATPIDRQLAASPRFVRDDEGATLFLRYVSVNFHRGEDYDPKLHYGYVNGCVGFTFIADTSYGAWMFNEPVLSSSNVVLADHFDHIDDKAGRVWADLCLDLREELFFALFDICRLQSEAGGDWPTVRERDPENFDYYRQKFPKEAHLWTGTTFGRNLHGISGMPMCSPLSTARTSFSSMSWATGRADGLSKLVRWTSMAFRPRMA